MSEEITKKENKSSKNQKNIEFCLGYCEKRINYTTNHIIIQNNCPKKKLTRLIKKHFSDSEYSIVVE